MISISDVLDVQVSVSCFNPFSALAAGHRCVHHHRCDLANQYKSVFSMIND